MRILNKIMGFLGYVPKKEYNKQATLIKCYLDAMKRAVELKDEAILQLSSCKNVVAEYIDRMQWGSLKEGVSATHLLVKLVDICPKCYRAKCICEISDALMNRVIKQKGEREKQCGRGEIVYGRKC